MIHFVHSVNLNEGGVSSSVLALDKAIRKNGFASSICTRPKDYLKKENENTGMIAHGLWQWPSLEAMRIHQKNKVPYLVFPHGMLDPWFKKEYPLKHFKKQIYWWLKQGEILRRANAVCFTTEEERLLSQGTFWPSRFHSVVTGLGVEDPPAKNFQMERELILKFPVLKNKRILLYLGRFHEKKGVDLLLNVWAQKRNNDEILVLAGPETKGSYFLKLKEIASQKEESIVWTGMLEGEQKWSMLRMADALILPSHQENFGMVVAEALAVGTPVYLTNKVNLWREVIESNAGYVDSDDQAGINRLVDKWKTKSHREMIPNTVSCFQEKLHINQTAQKIISMFESSKMVKATNIE